MRIIAAPTLATLLLSTAAQSAPYARPLVFESRLSPAIVDSGPDDQRLAINDRMTRWKIPGVSIAVIEGCRIVAARGYGVTSQGGAEVDPATLFQAASVSKPVAALGALVLVDQRKLALDGNVGPALKSWHLPQSPLLADHPVTLRGLLSHSAGLVPGGYGGFAAGQPLPTLGQTLNGDPPAKPKPVAVAYVPGSEWRYSGGGYLVVQQLMSDVTGLSFAEYMNDRILLLAGMKDSRFAILPPPGRPVAMGHKASGIVVAGGWHRYPEYAAAGLWSTAPDLAAFAMAIMAAERSDDGLLKPSIAKLMTAAAIGPRSLGFVVEGEGTAKKVGHDGTNEGFNSSLLFFPGTCQGAVILTNSDNAKPFIAELQRAIAETYGWPAQAASHRIEKRPLTAAISTRFVGDYKFADLPQVDPFRIERANGEYLVFDRGDGHREPLFATLDGLYAPDTGVLIKMVKDQGNEATEISYARIGGRSSAIAARVR